MMHIILLLTAYLLNITPSAFFDPLQMTIDTV